MLISCVTKEMVLMGVSLEVEPLVPNVDWAGIEWMEGKIKDPGPCARMGKGSEGRSAKPPPAKTKTGIDHHSWQDAHRRIGFEILIDRNKGRIEDDRLSDVTGLSVLQRDWGRCYGAIRVKGIELQFRQGTVLGRVYDTVIGLAGHITGSLLTVFSDFYGVEHTR